MKLLRQISLIHRVSWAILILCAACASSSGAMEIAYKVSMPNPSDHYFHIQMDLRDVTVKTLDLKMPAWAPGRYLILNFARNVSDFEAESTAGSLPFYKTDKQTWRIETQGAKNVVVHYRVYGNNLSGELSLLNDQQAFLDGASLYLYADGYQDKPVVLEIAPPPGWMILSSAGELGQTEFTFSNYDWLIDELVQLGTFFVERFTIASTEYRISVVSQNNQKPPASLIEKIHALQDAAVKMLGAIDSPRYTFFYHFLPDSRDSAGMEHFNGCQLTRKHAIHDAGAAMELTLWVTAHELMHAWNGKRLRPKNLGPFDYTQETYTNLLWFEEGITSYLADLILLRSGVWTKENFCKQLAEQIAAFRSSPGAHQRSPEEASFDTWLWPIDGSRESDWYNTWVSYYTSGELLGACMDLEIRNRTKNKSKFEDFFLLLYDRFYRNAEPDSYYAPGRGYTKGDVRQALEDATHSSWQSFFDDYLASPGDIPFDQFLEYAALVLREKKDESSPYTGLHLISAPGGYAQIQWLDRRSPASSAGLATLDTIIALDGERVYLRDFDDVLRRRRIDEEVNVSFLRDNRLLNVVLKLPNDRNIVRYEILDAPRATLLARKIRNDWIQSPKENRPRKKNSPRK